MQVEEKFDTIGRYTILKVLGRGGMGVVYLATDSSLNRQVALKVLSDYDLPDAARRERFLREARAAAAIRHPNVATIYEVGETARGIPYIAMEYCEGQTLSRLIEVKPLDTLQFLRIARQLAEGVAAAHAKGVIHRDIKSANIIVEENGAAKILDFGLAKVVQPEASSVAETSVGGRFFGTVPYLSPEQTRGLPADERSDLFSLGIVFFEMLTGKLPFDADTPLALMEKIRDSEPAKFAPLDPTIPRHAVDIIRKLLQKDPAERYQTAAEVSRDLATVEGRFATSTTRVSSRSFRVTLGRTRPLRRRAILAIAISVAAAIVLTVIVFFKMNGRVATPTVAAGPIRSIAVLPFQNLSGSVSDEFLSVSLADALITDLQHIPALNVRPTSAVTQFYKSPADANSAGEKLKVDGVVEGGFLSDGKRVRVNIQLTDSRTGYSVWSDTVESPRGDLLKLIDSVSGRTVTALHQRLSSPGNAGPTEARSANPAAFEYYLKARAVNGTLIPEESDEQVRNLKKAVNLDPAFAAAYADLAIAISLREVHGFETGDTSRQQAEWYARQAVRLDPLLPEAHLALGKTLIRYPERFRESLRESLAALRLSPNDPQALYALVSYFLAAGDLDRAAAVGDRLVSVNPTSVDAKTRGYWYINAVDPDTAQSLAGFALDSPDTALAGHDILALAYLMRGDIHGAEVEQKLAAALLPNHFIPRSLAAMIAAAKGDRATVDKNVRLMKTDLEHNHWAASRAVLAYAKLGDRQQALYWLRRCVELGNHSWYLWVKHPWMAPLQGTPEYQRYVSQFKQELDDVRDDAIGVADYIIARKPV